MGVALRKYNTTPVFTFIIRIVAIFSYVHFDACMEVLTYFADGIYFEYFSVKILCYIQCWYESQPKV